MKKTCCICKKEKEIEMFCKDKREDDGKSTTCRQCCAEYRSLNKDKISKYQNEYRKNHKEEIRKNLNKYKENNKRKLCVHSMVRYYIDNGLMIRSEYCQDCGVMCKTEGHHENYNEPKNVLWLCRKCHKIRHRKYKIVGIYKKGE